MADVIDYKIYGDDLQLVEVELDQGELAGAMRASMSVPASIVPARIGDRMLWPPLGLG